MARSNGSREFRLILVSRRTKTVAWSWHGRGVEWRRQLPKLIPSPAHHLVCVCLSHRLMLALRSASHSNHAPRSSNPTALTWTFPLVRPSGSQPVVRARYGTLLPVVRARYGTRTVGLCLALKTTTTLQTTVKATVKLKVEGTTVKAIGLLRGSFCKVRALMRCWLAIGATGMRLQRVERTDYGRSLKEVY